jgi:hypothetical protein
VTGTNIFLGILLGLGLSASTGLNTFLPLLLLPAAARFHVAGIELGAKFEWLTSDAAIITLIVACDRADRGQDPGRRSLPRQRGHVHPPAAGALATCPVLTGVDPWSPRSSASSSAPPRPRHAHAESRHAHRVERDDVRLRESRDLAHRRRDLVLPLGARDLVRSSCRSLAVLVFALYRLMKRISL